ncbi:MAG: endonuclease III [Pseudomonadota bacterium]
MSQAKSKPYADTLMDDAAIAETYKRLSDTMPGRTPTATGPKGQRDPFQSCVSCMLSAQSRDVNTAKAANQLFALADTPEGILALSDEQIATAIKPCGLYNMKTKNLRKMCSFLLEELNGEVPTSRPGLMSMPGIGRKCADIVMNFTFGEDVIAVDTHIHRVCNRLGLAAGKTEEQTAKSLEKRSPDWAKRDGHFWLLQFGKKICPSRAPKCGDCFLSDLCLWDEKRI